MTRVFRRHKPEVGEAQDLELMTTKTQDPQDLSAFQVPATTGKQKYDFETD